MSLQFGDIWFTIKTFWSRFETVCNAKEMKYNPLPLNYIYYEVTLSCILPNATSTWFVSWSSRSADTIKSAVNYYSGDSRLLSLKGFKAVSFVCDHNGLIAPTIAPLPLIPPNKLTCANTVHTTFSKPPLYDLF